MQYGQYDICHWVLSTALMGDAEAAATYNSSYSLRINLTSYTDVFVSLNNGSSPALASNQVTVSEYTEQSFTYKLDQVVYLVAVAYGSKPSFKFTYEYVIPSTIGQPPKLNCTGASYTLSNGSVVCNETQVIIIKKDQEIPKSKPKWAVIAIMGLVSIGIITFYVVDLIDSKYKSKEAKKLKVVNTHLTDYELQPIEKQILDYDDAKAYFNSMKNASASTAIDNRSSSAYLFEKNSTIFT